MATIILDDIELRFRVNEELLIINDEIRIERMRLINLMNVNEMKFYEELNELGIIINELVCDEDCKHKCKYHHKIFCSEKLFDTLSNYDEDDCINGCIVNDDTASICGVIIDEIIKSILHNIPLGKYDLFNANVRGITLNNGEHIGFDELYYALKELNSN